jgi:hypothetical protein
MSPSKIHFNLIPWPIFLFTSLKQLPYYLHFLLTIHLFQTATQLIMLQRPILTHQNQIISICLQSPIPHNNFHPFLRLTKHALPLTQVSSHIDQITKIHLIPCPQISTTLMNPLLGLQIALKINIVYLTRFKLTIPNLTQHICSHGLPKQSRHCPHHRHNS